MFVRVVAVTKQHETTPMNQRKLAFFLKKTKKVLELVDQPKNVIPGSYMSVVGYFFFSCLP